MNCAVIRVVLVVVHNCIGIPFRCAENRIANHVTACAFIDNTISSFVYIDGTVNVGVQNDF